MTLRDIRPGESARVLRLTGGGALRRRILDLGIVPGVEIAVRKAAPLGDPLELSLRGYQLSLRKGDAATIEVEKI
ncbi:MAG: ferrous iron transport protein A [Oscillospiraceae bacterium]|nr:ferrous iron transport protein A [Oscillospiraceae bacterium]